MTCLRTSSRTVAGRLKLRETVATETPARRATSDTLVLAFMIAIRSRPPAFPVQPILFFWSLRRGPYVIDFSEKNNHSNDAREATTTHYRSRSFRFHLLRVSAFATLPTILL